MFNFFWVYQYIHMNSILYYSRRAAVLSIKPYVLTIALNDNWQNHHRSLSHGGALAQLYAGTLGQHPQQLTSNQ